MNTEGVIQYQQHWKEGQPFENSLIQPLEQWRKKLFNAGLIGAYPDGLGYGNLSLRYQHGFIITGTQTGHLPDLDGHYYTFVSRVNIAENRLWCEGPVRASSEGMTHAACYALDHTIQTVFHIHHRQMWQSLMGKWPTSPSDISYGTPAMARAVGDVWNQHGNPLPFQLVMAGHEEGIIVAGRMMDEVGALLLNAWKSAT
ncbi:MAG: class II aldolase/adducin family protein [Bacteroidia bacterium]